MGSVLISLPWSAPHLKWEAGRVVAARAALRPSPAFPAEERDRGLLSEEAQTPRRRRRSGGL